MILVLLQIILVLLIAGVVIWGVQALPAIDATFKQIVKVVVIVVCLIVVVLLLASLFGVGLGHLVR